MLDRLSSTKYTVIYTTTPLPAEQDLIAAESERYHIDTSFQSPVHMDLKREFSNHKRSSNSSKASPNRPLFEKYQFFTPGIFMGILVSILLISILYVGVSGIASLQVSYSAFDKEMGPAAMKKQMQQ